MISDWKRKIRNRRKIIIRRARRISMKRRVEGGLELGGLRGLWFEF